MIVTHDEQLSDKKQQPQPVPDDSEPPPSYSQTEPVASGSGSGSTPSQYPTFKTKPTNHLLLATGDKTIRGEFVIDPFMRIPSSMLPPLGDGETEADRKNLSLSSKHSSVQPEIWLLGPSSMGENGDDPSMRKLGRTTISLVSEHGSIRAQLVRTLSLTSVSCTVADAQGQRTLPGTPPFSLTARAPHGSIRLALSQSFQGLLLLSTRESVSVCDALVQDATQLSQIGTTRRYFVGDVKLLGDGDGDGNWDGDRVEVDATHGSIKIKYVDEAEESQGKKGFFGRLFGK